MTEVIRLLHAIGTSEIGGTERFLLRLIGGMSRQFVNGIVVLDRPGALAEEYSSAAGFVVHLGKIGPIDWPLAAVRWQDARRRFDPDLLILYGARSNLLGRLFHGSNPVVMALRSTVIDDRGSAIAAALDRWTFNRVALCISNSRASIDRLVGKGYPPDRFSFVPQAIDLQKFEQEARVPAETDQSNTIISVANLKPVKDHRTLLRASGLLRKREIAHKLWIVGDGPERSNLEALARQLGVNEHVTFMGSQARTVPLLKAASVFVLTSRWEGAPTAILEAMAAGLPVVASNVGEVPRLVEDGISGRLVEPGNVEGFASAIEQLLADSALRQRWATAARERVQQFSFAATIPVYERLFAWAARRGELSELRAMQRCE